MDLPHPIARLNAVLFLATIAIAQDAAPLLPESALLACERSTDRPRLIRDRDKVSRERGEKIHPLVCHSCRSDRNLAGSIPNALRFAGEKFSHDVTKFRVELRTAFSILHVACPRSTPTPLLRRALT